MLTVSAATQLGPLMLETVIKHYLKRKSVTKYSKAREELLFDEAFVVVKTFLEISTRHTVDELQKFSLTRTLSPPWVLLHRVLIPISPTCSRAAEILIEALGGPEQALKICGGTKWWTVRMQAGVEAEWIGIKSDWQREERRRKQATAEKKKRRASLSRQERAKETVKDKFKRKEDGENDDQANEADYEHGDFAPEMDHLRCMLYIHGGAYYWGSINTHRYSIWRYARKMRGRCFAVNYRKAPQFPFPCALQDCIAAYLYLLNPPEGAKHHPIDPRKIIIAGDSAGGGLTMALLQVIRDTGLPMPAGAVLISPWGDLTHSFPSILENTASDIIPPYGFIHKPSTLWPPPPPEMTEEVQGSLRSKVKEVAHKLAGMTFRGSDDTSSEHEDVDVDVSSFATAPPPKSSLPKGPKTALGDTKIPTSPTSEKHTVEGDTLYPAQKGDESNRPSPTKPKAEPSSSDPAAEKHFLALDIDGKPVTIRSQIQLYCTNDQLSHPYVSPALGYLGGLPPLLIIASDKEVLRDEIMYSAHKAAYPEKYPVREEIKELLPSLKDIDGKYPPTRVHLQVYDGTCHVLPLFSMCEPAKHCYRAIANFCRFVTHNEEHTVKGPKQQHSMPEPFGTHSDLHLHSHSDTDHARVPRTAQTLPPTLISNDLAAGDFEIREDDPINSSPGALHPVNPAESSIPSSVPSLDTPTTSHTRGSANSSYSNFKRSFSQLGGFSKRKTSEDVDSPPPSGTITPTESEYAMPEDTDIDERVQNRDNQNSGATTPLDSDFPDDELKMPKNIPPDHAGNREVYEGNPFAHSPMIRERVSLRGVIRGLEPEEDLPALHMPLKETGVIKEGPALRYLNGQTLWDEKFKHEARRIAKRRRDHLKKAETDAEKAVEMWESRVREQKDKVNLEGGEKTPFDEKAYIFDNEYSWTWALKGELPPPTAIVGRRDTNESRRLAHMADQMTDSNIHLGGLSLWTAMNSFFSKESGAASSSEPHHETRQPRASGGIRPFPRLKGKKASLGTGTSTGMSAAKTDGVSDAQ